MPNRFTWADQALWRLVQYLMGIYPVLLGSSVLVGGGARFVAPPSFAVLNEWAPWWVWGSAPVMFALFGLAPCWYSRVVSTVGLTVFFWLWFGAITAGVLDNPLGVLTGVATYFTASVVYTGFAVATVMDRS